MQLFIIFLCTLLFGFNIEIGNPLPIKDKSKLKHFKEHYAKVPQGTIDINGHKYTLGSDFYMFKTEVTNLNYKEFIADLKKTNQFDHVEDLVCIRNTKGASISAETYFQHAAYENYPVVNITKEAAGLYCKWLGEKLAQNLEVDPSKIEVRLPTKVEWIYAAKATKSENVYGWSGPYLRNAEGKILANFNMSLTTEDITFDEATQSYKVIQSSLENSSSLHSPAMSYLPNDLGLFNMSGNVAEFVNDNADLAMGGSYKSTGYDIRTESEVTVKDKNAQTGFRPIVIFK